MYTQALQIPPGQGFLGQLAESVLMFDRVGVLVHSGVDAAEALRGVELLTLEHLVDSDTLFFLVESAAPFITDYRSLPQLQENEAFGLLAAESNGLLSPGFMRFGPSFEETFLKHTKSYLPRALAESLLSKSKTVNLDYSRIISVSNDDFLNPAVMSALDPWIVGALSDLARQVRKNPKEQVNPKDIEGVRTLLGQALLEVLSANHMLAITAHGYSVSCHGADQRIMQAKMDAVFQVDSSERRRIAFNALLELNSVPSVRSLVTDGASFSQIVDLRRKHGASFRRWFQSLTDQPGASPRVVEQEWTDLLRSAGIPAPTMRRLSIFGLEQIGSVVHPLLGAGISLANALAPNANRNRPYLLMENLRDLSRDRPYRL